MMHFSLALADSAVPSHYIQGILALDDTPWFHFVMKDENR
jgi:hypothetical protein